MAEYEVWYDEENRALLDEYERALGFTAQGVPVTIVGDQVWIGFSESIAAQIEAALPTDEAATEGPVQEASLQVPLLETPCTAGPPLMWTALLADHGVSRPEAVALFGLYMAVFLIDELLLFAAAVVTMRATKVQERHGRGLKMLAGSVLVTLATAMLVAPEVMTSLIGTATVFVVAVSVAFVLWWLDQWFARRRAAVGRS